MTVRCVLVGVGADLPPRHDTHQTFPASSSHARAVDVSLTGFATHLGHAHGSINIFAGTACGAAAAASRSAAADDTPVACCGKPSQEGRR